MLSAQIVKQCLEELTAITKVEFCMQDLNGQLFAMTSGAVIDHYLMKVFEDDEVSYILTAIGRGEHTLMVAKIAVSEVQNLMIAYKEKYDRNNFFQNLLLDNLLQVDIHNRAKKLHISCTGPRAVIVVETMAEGDSVAGELLGSIFTTQNGDYLTEVDENSVIVIKSLDREDDYESLNAAAQTAVDMLNTEAMVKARAAFGSIILDLNDLSKSYKEAKMALDVGKIFYAERLVTSLPAAFKPVRDVHSRGFRRSCAV